MARYALRLLLILPTLFLVTLFVFATVRAIPGDVVDIMLEQFQYGASTDPSPNSKRRGSRRGTLALGVRRQYAR